MSVLGVLLMATPGWAGIGWFLPKKPVENANKLSPDVYDTPQDMGFLPKR